MEYKFIADLNTEAAIPDHRMISRVLHKDESVNVTVFGFAAGEGLSPHAAPTPAILCFIDGEGTVQLGEDSVQVQPGSIVYLPPSLRHAVSARSALRMLLVQIKCDAHR